MHVVGQSAQHANLVQHIRAGCEPVPVGARRRSRQINSHRDTPSRNTISSPYGATAANVHQQSELMPRTRAGYGIH
ncbi:hypothetical protein MBOT_00870 [Mycobacterium botniense]|uniref:Uncharacterized protein n=1 Tax=Mycobacterium botniense TaxID=84962 RepID=A0A7I9XRU3_9MYCO|nr:hypothetical protein MBOT_00870 [Mycobacterium botniense]